MPRPDVAGVGVVSPEAWSERNLRSRGLVDES